MNALALRLNSLRRYYLHIASHQYRNSEHFDDGCQCQLQAEQQYGNLRRWIEVQTETNMLDITYETHATAVCIHHWKNGR